MAYIHTHIYIHHITINVYNTYSVNMFIVIILLYCMLKCMHNIVARYTMLCSNIYIYIFIVNMLHETNYMIHIYLYIHTYVYI